MAAFVRTETEKLFIGHEATATGSGYVAPLVMLEFGARSTGKPASLCDVGRDAAALVEGVAFPAELPRVMHADRKVWEKATAIRVFGLHERLRSNRFARHRHDLDRLHKSGFGAAALADRSLARAVARLKNVFFA